MEFTYQAYKDLLELLRNQGYALCGYHNYTEFPRCAILRHDIDSSLSQAVKLAALEAEEGVRSTWFVLLRTEFYNPFSNNGLAALQRIQSLGHEIGLHFDEAAYVSGLEPDEVIRNIGKERRLLSELLDTEVLSVSMHCPSKVTLEADYHIPGAINAYSRTFFHDFKYLSDSSRRWREPVKDIIRSGEYDRLHILTHAFWYHEEEQDLSQALGAFIRSANRERYIQVVKMVDKSLLYAEDVL